MTRDSSTTSISGRSWRAASHAAATPLTGEHLHDDYAFVDNRGKAAAPSSAQRALVRDDNLVTRWNKLADSGHDDDFGRGDSAYDGWCGDRSQYPGPMATLGPLDTAPYYAVELVSSTLGTKGGPRTDVDAQPTIADGIAVAKPGVLNFEIIRDTVDEIVTVSDDDTAKAMLVLLERAKLVVEAAGAVGIAGYSGSVSCYLVERPSLFSL